MNKRIERKAKERKQEKRERRERKTRSIFDIDMLYSLLMSFVYYIWYNYIYIYKLFSYKVNIYDFPTKHQLTWSGIFRAGDRRDPRSCNARQCDPSWFAQVSGAAVWKCWWYFFWYLLFLSFLDDILFFSIFDILVCFFLMHFFLILKYLSMTFGYVRANSGDPPTGLFL